MIFVSLLEPRPFSLAPERMSGLIFPRYQVTCFLGTGQCACFAVVVCWGLLHKQPISFLFQILGSFMIGVADFLGAFIPSSLGCLGSWEYATKEARKWAEKAWERTAQRQEKKVNVSCS